MLDYFGKNASELRNKTLWLLDMDGTIYQEEQIFEGKLEETGNWDQGTLKYEELIKDKGLIPVDYYEIKTEHAIRKSGPYPDANMDLLKDRK